VRLFLVLLASLALSACNETRERAAQAIPFMGEDGPPGETVTLSELAASPSVYAGRLISVSGLMSVNGEEACLEDRGLAIAVRLSPEQATAHQSLDDAPMTATGVFDQNICPAGQLCPTLCARAGFARLEELR